MATAMLHFLPQAPHQMWQTAASPFILPSSWQTRYARCPRCGGSAPNVCDEVWPDKWWEDDMLGLMYQGHIPPSQRTSPWDEYYSRCRVNSFPAPVPQQAPLQIDTNYAYYHHDYPHQAHMAANVPITPPQTPGVITHLPYYSQPRPASPQSPLLYHGRRGVFNPTSSFDSTHTAPSPIMDLDDSPRRGVSQRLRRLFF